MGFEVFELMIQRRTLRSQSNRLPQSFVGTQTILVVLSIR